MKRIDWFKDRQKVMNYNWNLKIKKHVVRKQDKVCCSFFQLPFIDKRRWMRHWYSWHNICPNGFSHIKKWKRYHFVFEYQIREIKHLILVKRCYLEFQARSKYKKATIFQQILLNVATKKGFFWCKQSPESLCIVSNRGHRYTSKWDVLNQKGETWIFEIVNFIILVMDRS